ncbi:MAG: hypothetical protein IT336_05185, partial [Thermomicrobiales bacterium]|nr:hypothetical protein [Thermomicrobiales bacterium]
MQTPIRISNRWRVLAPLTAAGALMSRPARGRATPDSQSAALLASLLNAVPLAILGEEQPQILATWADLSAQ